MEGLMLAVAMLAGVSETGERDLVLNQCMEKAVPGWEWRAQVLAEAQRQRIRRSGVVCRFLPGGDWYRKEAGWVRSCFVCYFNFDEQVWYLTGEGKKPNNPLCIVWVNRRVREMGKALPGAMKEYEYQSRPREFLAVKGDAK